MNVYQDDFEFDMFLLLRDLKLVCDKRDRNSALRIPRTYGEELSQYLGELQYYITQDAYRRDNVKDIKE